MNRVENMRGQSFSLKSKSSFPLNKGTKGSIGKLGDKGQGKMKTWNFHFLQGGNGGGHGWGGVVCHGRDSSRPGGSHAEYS